MALFLCPYLGQSVELTDERRIHIAERHPGILPIYEPQLIETMAIPDTIHKSKYDEAALIFSKWFDNISSGRYLIAIVVQSESKELPRVWMITVYTSKKIPKGAILWKND
jgi:hypothetical protein